MRYKVKFVDKVGKKSLMLTKAALFIQKHSK